ncbi:NAD(P)/FAD-dependent oxidoreductase [Saccharopolyspora sp. TS4A08]|uniref:NAD(P)/FAD-dependent oxidoreductase n=1 Tax=Saccharopolyspora ipomoeae TaxID=3042027 RepID=A0ABT6PQU0_9PSEU|nr:NAD(P)/FAD-dependent oxidoreductase [Saccharopolyspora sp. TS4A08]MDI2030378.1 NAD(P)/FAD-dependent oxidoreductase [Saccharopolyspora sp. TS4A08]
MSAENADAVVCGAGVGGLAAAHALGALGLRVVVVEKRATVPRIPKGEVLQPGALKILRAWGVSEVLEERGAVRLSRLVAVEARGRMALDYSQLPDGSNWLLSADHESILEALADTLPDTVELRRGVPVSDVVRDGGRIAGAALNDGEIRAPLVVAADGISSRLRKAAGIEARRRDYPHRLVALDLADVPDAAPEVVAHTTARGLRMRYPLPGSRIRLYVQIQPDEFRGIDDVGLRGWTDSLLTELPELAEFEEQLRTAVEHRQTLPVSHFTAPAIAAPGIALVGESAHSVHPMAAQGMNSAIYDAHALSTGLAERSDVDGALRDYQDRRLPEIEQIGTISHNASRMLTDLSWAGRAIGRRALRNTGANRRLSYQVMHNLAGLGLHPMTPFDRLCQLGLVPDPRSRRRPRWA